MKWVLSCFTDIRDWVPGKDLLYKQYRENNKFFEFWGRSNKAGIFVDIVVFFGGARLGSVMVPASSNRAGWCLFSKELDSFLAGSNTVGVEGRNSGGAAGGGQLYGGSHDGKKFFKTGNQREGRNFENSRAYLGHNVFKGETATVTVSKKKNGRPTRDFMFKVNSDTLTLALRVSLSEGGKRVVSWMNPLDSHKAITRGNPVGKRGVPWVDRVKLQRQVAVGPVVSKPQAQAHVANKTHLVADTCVTNGLKVLVGCGQGTSGSGDSSTEPGVAAMTPTVGLEAPMREIPLPSPIRWSAPLYRRLPSQIGSQGQRQRVLRL